MTRYLKKGEFICVPFLDRIKGEHPITQTIYLWMNKFVGEGDVCYPSIQKLAECCGCGISSVREYIKRLEDMGVIERNRRFKEGLETSSEYKILYPSPDGPPPSPRGDELNTLIIIENKTDILNIMGDDYCQKYKNQLICLWYMIALGYKVEKTQQNIQENIDRIKEKADIYGYRMVDGNYDWNSIKQKFDKWFEWHNKKKDKITNYKSSVLQFLDNNNNTKGKRKK